MSYINNRTCQIPYKFAGIKICYKIDKFAFEGNKSKVVRGTFRLKKVVPTPKSMRNSVLHHKIMENTKF